MACVINIIQNFIKKNIDFLFPPTLQEKNDDSDLNKSS